MKAIVRINPRTYDSFFAPVAKQYPGLIDKLIRDFKRYVDSDRNYQPSYFGRDCPYVEPPLAYSSRLMHLHLNLSPSGFPHSKPRNDRTSDTALVYVRGELDDYQYSLLAVFHPDAHHLARDSKMMNYLARIAKDFREEY
ncbi:type II toxin-antitoxin system YafO family toxin [Pseudomonas sp.]|uniref:type II toxin-antitoxin system YafO family toxin n=1 Tax=Pseudomonas sp. TaxID=306 RepID=UPI002897BEFA|nr:type II toxin-antitoxin system YafO family toxin [Pseudomonas sp.]